MQICEVITPKLLDPRELHKELAGTQIHDVIYHGANAKFSKFNRPAHGVFFSPHYESADFYSSRGSIHSRPPKTAIVIAAYVWAPKVLVFNSPDSTFLEDYAECIEEIPKLQQKGYYAAQQLMTESQMICVFGNARIYNAYTGALM